MALIRALILLVCPVFAGYLGFPNKTLPDYLDRTFHQKVTIHLHRWIPQWWVERFNQTYGMRTLVRNERRFKCAIATCQTTMFFMGAMVCVAVVLALMVIAMSSVPVQGLMEVRYPVLAALVAFAIVLPPLSVAWQVILSIAYSTQDAVVAVMVAMAEGSPAVDYVAHPHLVVWND